jgi:hypothetical protein
MCQKASFSCFLSNVSECFLFLFFPPFVSDGFSPPPFFLPSVSERFIFPFFSVSPVGQDSFCFFFLPVRVRGRGLHSSSIPREGGGGGRAGGRGEEEVREEKGGWEGERKDGGEPEREIILPKPPSPCVSGLVWSRSLKVRVFFETPSAPVRLSPESDPNRPTMSQILVRCLYSAVFEAGP